VQYTVYHILMYCTPPWCRYCAVYSIPYTHVLYTPVVQVLCSIQYTIYSCTVHPRGAGTVQYTLYHILMYCTPPWCRYCVVYSIPYTHVLYTPVVQVQCSIRYTLYSCAITSPWCSDEAGSEHAHDDGGQRKSRGTGGRQASGANGSRAALYSLYTVLTTHCTALGIRAARGSTSGQDLRDRRCLSSDSSDGYQSVLLRRRWWTDALSRRS
jgi:hypothetical protein